MEKEFRLFPNIRLVSSDVPPTAGENELMICCCISGICEYHIRNEYRYLTPDNILAFGNCYGYTSMCSKDFRGLFLMIGTGFNAHDYSDMFGISKILRDISQNERFVYQTDSAAKDLLSAMIMATEKSMTSLMRLKAIELLMLICENKIDRKSFKKAEQTGEFICRNISDHFTIPQISEVLSINQTTLKSDFRRTYGCGIYAYAKKRKMFRAAELLTQTDMKIIDIAEEVGYSNASKFAKAFHSVIGTTPKRFRTEHKIRKQPKKLLSEPVSRY